ncbi:MAG: Uma2 family endonuclease [Tepidisphaerales bacterium]
MQHLVLEDVSWGLYERMLKEIGDRPLRLTFDNGSMEIMSPLPEHEDVKEFLGLVVQMLAMLLHRPVKSLGSTTFRRHDKQQGLEPDKCFYFKDEVRVRGLKRWDAKKDPPPELVVEVDIFSSSIDREPIYASLGVPEIWRYDGRKLQCLHLLGQRYSVRKFSRAFPFLEVALLNKFVSQLSDRDEGSILREFMAWVKKNGWAKSEGGP